MIKRTGPVDVADPEEATGDDGDRLAARVRHLSAAQRHHQVRQRGNGIDDGCDVVDEPARKEGRGVKKGALVGGPPTRPRETLRKRDAPRGETHRPSGLMLRT